MCGVGMCCTVYTRVKWSRKLYAMNEKNANCRKSAEDGINSFALGPNAQHKALVQEAEATPLRWGPSAQRKALAQISF